jgi:hypothetical protein
MDPFENIKSKHKRAAGRHTIEKRKELAKSKDGFGWPFKLGLQLCLQVASFVLAGPWLKKEMHLWHWPL